MNHDYAEYIKVTRMNQIIQSLPEYEKGMAVVHIGSGLDLYKNRVRYQTPASSGMMSRAAVQFEEERNVALRLG